ncbi:putative holin [Erwinia phage Zoomie]|uniref:Holin n=1 Tax=Erwinia phage Zoomie TaxID=2851072 RepID=A0A9E6T3Q7_9CAUD|nr:putative holin [Erwinia phage Zoomie]
MIHKNLEAVTYGTSGGLTFGGWLLQHLPSPDVTAQLASWIGILTGVGMFVCTVYFKWKNSRLYKKALERGYVNQPSSEE